MQELTELAKYGLTGISLGLIILMGIVIRKLFSFMGNHVDHNTQSLQELRDAIHDLKDYLEKQG